MTGKECEACGDTEGLVPIVLLVDDFEVRGPWWLCRECVQPDQVRAMFRGGRIDEN
jgi:hypothetical protein